MEDAYYRVYFKTLMDLLMQYGVSLTLTRWIAGALLERTFVKQFPNWSSAPLQLTMGPTTRITAFVGPLQCIHQRPGRSEPKNLLRKILTLEDDGLICKTSKGSQEAAEAVQQQLDNVSQWCHDTGSLINPDKAQTLRCTFASRTVGETVPACTFDGAVV